MTDETKLPTIEDVVKAFIEDENKSVDDIAKMIIKLHSNLKKEKQSKPNMFPPIMDLTKRMQALFGQDPQVTAVCDFDNDIINVAVGNPDKEDAYRFMLPQTITFGKQVVKFTVNNKPVFQTKCNTKVLNVIFKENPLFKEIKYVYFPDSTELDRIFMIMKNKTVLWYSDDFSSYYGTSTKTAEDMVKYIFHLFDLSKMVSVCTEFEGMDESKEDE